MALVSFTVHSIAMDIKLDVTILLLGDRPMLSTMCLSLSTIKWCFVALKRNSFTAKGTQT